MTRHSGILCCTPYIYKYCSSHLQHWQSYNVRRFLLLFSPHCPSSSPTPGPDCLFFPPSPLSIFLPPSSRRVPHAGSYIVPSSPSLWVYPRGFTNAEAQLLCGFPTAAAVAPPLPTSLLHVSVLAFGWRHHRPPLQPLYIRWPGVRHSRWDSSDPRRPCRSPTRAIHGHPRSLEKGLRPNSQPAAMARQEACHVAE